MNPLIINRPDLQSAVQRIGFNVITILFWMGFGYLWIPALTLLAWSLELSFFYHELIVMDGFHNLLVSIAFYSLVILMIAGIYFLWSAFNYLRFSGLDRRKHAPHVSNENLSRSFGIPSEYLPKLQSARVLTIRHDEQGRIVHLKKMV